MREAGEPKEGAQAAGVSPLPRAPPLRSWPRLPGTPATHPRSPTLGLLLLRARSPLHRPLSVGRTLTPRASSDPSQEATSGSGPRGPQC